MCFAKPPQDNSAQVAAQQEAERQARITAGTSKVNDAFAKFDDSYYSGLGKAFGDYYNPQLDTQYDNTNKQLTYSLANSGLLGSSEAARQEANLQKLYGQNRQQIANEGLQQQDSARSSVANNKSQLISQLEGGAGVDTTANSALALADQQSRPAPYSPLADMFGQFTSTLKNNTIAQAAGYPGLQGLPTFNRGGGSAPSGSFKTVG